MASKKHEEEKENVWESILSKVAPSSKEENSTLIIFGDKKNGKSELLKKMKLRESDAKTKEYFVDYSYIKVTNVHDESEADEVRAFMNVWEIDSTEQAAGMLPLFLKSTGFKNAVYMITLDLSQPWGIMDSLNKWIEVLKTGHAALFDKVSPAEQKVLKDKISAFNQFYLDPTKKEADQQQTTEQPAEIKLDPSNPRINLGVPLVIVGCKADQLAPLFAEQSYAGDRFEFITRRLRQFCLDYGASLIFTSSTRAAGVNIDVLQEYIYHRLYKFDLVHKPKVVGSETEYTFFVPSGHDSVGLIDAIKPAKRIEDDASFDVVFKRPPPPQSRQDKADEEVRAEDNQTFFNSLKFLMNAPPERSNASNPRPAPEPSPSNAPSSVSPVSKARQPSRIQPNPTGDTSNREVVRDFFQSLLANPSNAKKVVRGDVHSALTNMKSETGDS